MPDQSQIAQLVMMEDNDAVIKMLQKGRAPALGHVARTHRVNLDWLLERLHIDPAIWCRYVESRHQIADVLTKPGFTRDLWCSLLEQWRIAPPPTPKPPSASAASCINDSSSDVDDCNGLKTVTRGRMDGGGLALDYFDDIEDISTIDQMMEKLQQLKLQKMQSAQDAVK